METIIAAMKFISLLFLVLLFLDILTGNLWMNFATRIFAKLSELMLSGAVIELYHAKINNILGWLTIMSVISYQNGMYCWVYF